MKFQLLVEKIIPYQDLNLGPPTPQSTALPSALPSPQQIKCGRKTQLKKEIKGMVNRPQQMFPATATCQGCT